MSNLTAPHVDLTWTATGLGAAFQEYRVYRRPARLPVLIWDLVARVTVPSGYTPATVEANHTVWTDWQAGWSLPGGEWSDGWDYAVTVVNSTTGVESARSTLDTMNEVTADAGWWVTSNTAPYLNFPIVAVGVSGSDASGLSTSAPAGRDGLLSRTRLELPMRSYDIGFQDFTRLGEDPIRPWRAAASLGQLMALMGPRGDRAIGALDNPNSITHDLDGRFSAKGKFVETQRTSPVADFNVPAGIVLNGSSQYVTTADNALLNPTTGPFSVFVAGVFPNAGTVAVGKGDIAGATTSYYGITRPASNTIRFAYKGVTAAGNADDANAVWFDGNPHVAIGTSTGTVQALYRDGTLTNGGATTTGTVTNAKTFNAGADNSGVSGFMGLNPVRAWGYYPRVLTATEAQNLSYYLLGYPGYRPPAGANLFYDLRDSRTWNGTTTTLTDLTGNAAVGTLVNSPTTRGITAPLVLLDRYG